jgi:hypothetical protein
VLRTERNRLECELALLPNRKSSYGVAVEADLNGRFERDLAQE